MKNSRDKLQKEIKLLKNIFENQKVQLHVHKSALENKAFPVFFMCLGLVGLVGLSKLIYNKQFSRTIKIVFKKFFPSILMYSIRKIV